MNKITKYGIVGLFVMLAIGFAAIATTLIINGTINVGSNPADFDIYFSDAYTDDGGYAIIDTDDRKHISYASKKLSFVGNSTDLNYTVYNNSQYYDANVNVEFNATNTVDGIDYSSYYSLSFEGFDPTTSDHTTYMPGKTYKDGKITITLMKPLLKEVEIEFTLNLVTTAVERTSAADDGRISYCEYSNYDIVNVSKAIKGINMSDLPSPEAYVGDFYKINNDDLSSLGLSIQGNYYVNPNTGEVYDIDGKNDAVDLYGNTVSDITYHSIDDLKRIGAINDNIDVSKLMSLRDDQFNYLYNRQTTSDGAILTYTSVDNANGTIIPYFANISADNILGDVSSFEAVRNYINWYFNHINTTADVDGLIGTMYDYDYVNGVAQSKNKYDSVESYASTFLKLLSDYYKRTGDKQIILNHESEIQSIINVFNSTYNESLELTYAKKSYKIYFLMDNTESYNGYLAIYDIMKNVFNTNDYDYSLTRANAIKNSINKMWHEDENQLSSYYDYAYMNSSQEGLFTDKTIYPHALAQIYPVLEELVDSDSNKGKIVYYLLTNYSEPVWYNYNKHGSYPHMETLLVNLMYDDSYVIDNTVVDVIGDRRKAINRLYELSDTHLNLANYGVHWTSAEASYTVKSIDKYLDINSGLDITQECE